MHLQRTCGAYKAISTSKKIQIGERMEYYHTPQTLQKKNSYVARMLQEWEEWEWVHNDGLSHSLDKGMVGDISMGQRFRFQAT